MGVLKNLQPEDNPYYCGCNKKGEGFFLFGLLCSGCDKLFHSHDKDSCQSKPTFKPTIKAAIWACPSVNQGNAILPFAMTTSAHSHCRIVQDYCQG